MSEPIQICIEAGTFSSSVSQADADAQALAAAQALAIQECPGITPPTCPGGTDPTPSSLSSATPVSLGVRGLTMPFPNCNAPRNSNTLLFGASFPTPDSPITWGILPPGQYIINYVSGYFQGTEYDSPSDSRIYRSTGQFSSVWFDLYHPVNIGSGIVGAPMFPYFSCNEDGFLGVDKCSDVDIEAETLAAGPTLSTSDAFSPLFDGSFCVGAGPLAWGASYIQFISQHQVWLGTLQMDCTTNPCPGGGTCFKFLVDPGTINYELIRVSSLVCDQPPRVRIKDWTDEVRPLLQACPDCRDITDPDHADLPENEWDGTFQFLNTGCPGSAPDDQLIIYSISNHNTGPFNTYSLDVKQLGDNFTPGLFTRTAIVYRTDGVTGRWVLTIKCIGNLDDFIIWQGVKTTGCDSTGLYTKDTEVTMCSDMLDSVCVEAY